MDDGHTLRLTGQGDSGSKGGRPGSLFIVIHVEAHEKFERVGDDIHIAVPISITQACLGGTVIVPTLGKNAEVKVPPGDTLVATCSITQVDVFL